MPELERWFPVMRPPQGGSTRLQAAMAASGDAARSFRPEFAWAGLAIALAPLMLPGPTRDRQPDRVAEAMGELAERPLRTVSVAGGDAVEMARSDSSVRVFLVMTR
jgi:hypothetical protein